MTVFFAILNVVAIFIAGAACLVSGGAFSANAATWSRLGELDHARELDRRAQRTFFVGRVMMILGCIFALVMLGNWMVVDYS